MKKIVQYAIMVFAILTTIPFLLVVFPLRFVYNKITITWKISDEVFNWIDEWVG